MTADDGLAAGQARLASAIIAVGIGAEVGLVGMIIALENQSLGIVMGFVGVFTILVAVFRALPLVRRAG